MQYLWYGNCTSSLQQRGFVDLEQASDRLPGEVIRRAMRKLRVKERLVSAVVTVQELCIVRTGYGNGEVLEVGVGAHQGSGLIPLLFAIVMTAISRVSVWFTLEIAVYG